MRMCQLLLSWTSLSIVAIANTGCGASASSDLPDEQGGSGAASTVAGSGGLDAGRVAAQAGAPAGGAGGQPSRAEPYRISISMKAVAPGAEDHVCVVLALPNDRSVWLSAVHATLSGGSHHLIVDRRQPGTPLASEPTACAPTMGGDATRLLIAQQPDTQLRLPAGTALRIEPHQPIFLQLHYINASSKTEDVTGSVELSLFDDSTQAPIEAQSLFAGATSILVPSHQAGMAQFFFTPPGTARQLLHAFAVTSHTHSLGTLATIERVASATAPDAQPLHESRDWSEPPLTLFDPPLVFDGSDGLRLRCRYQNDTDHTVSFGTRFEDEMCFMWFYFYVDP